jgi:pyridoxine 5-phosphate synthase
MANSLPPPAQGPPRNSQQDSRQAAVLGPQRCKLSVNVNKLATIRNSRGKNNPDVVRSALDCVAFGAEGITVHPRPDERHIRRADVRAIALALRARAPGLEFNVEGYPDETYLRLLEDVRADQATLVPDPPDAITSNAGWRPQASAEILRSVVARLKKAGARVSVFVDPATMADAEYAFLRGLGVDRVELYTEAYAEEFGGPRAAETTARYVRAAELARASGLGVNAGHDLSLENLRGLAEAIPWLDEVSIGHALICDALYLGLREAIARYRGCLAGRA